MDMNSAFSASDAFGTCRDTLEWKGDDSELRAFSIIVFIFMPVV